MQDVKPVRILQIAITAIVANLVAIASGALVRATGSGAGCGESWPTCKGTLIPDLGHIHTVIEFSHRISTVVAAIFVAILFAKVYRNFPKRSVQRRAVHWVAMAFIGESLLGAWLVLYGLVAQDDSIMRAIMVPLHLVNTLFLLATLVATAWVATHREQRWVWSKSLRNRWLLAAIGVALLSATGAVAGLAGTLFPSEALLAGLAEDFDSRAHFLTRLRIIHPVLAIVVAAVLFNFAGGHVHRLGRSAICVMGLVGLQVLVGASNIVLHTPLVTQLSHLLLANFLWIALLIMGAQLATTDCSDD